MQHKPITDARPPARLHCGCPAPKPSAGASSPVGTPAAGRPGGAGGPGAEQEAGPDREVSAAVERELAQYLAGRSREAAASSDRFAADIVRQTVNFVLRGGKRLRPVSVWWGWRAAGGPATGARAQAVLRAAGALELLQACALIHDDIMDRSPLRRSAPAAHVAFADQHRVQGLRGSPETFGASAAILAGDLALVWADDLWADAGLDPSAGARAREPWRAMRTEMVAGQYLDLHHQAAGNESPAASLRVAYLKSALYTVERPLHLGAALAGADRQVISALRRAGRCTGLAFQLRDDLLSVFGCPADTGKPVGDDIREGKRTYLIAVALHRARQQGHSAAEGLLRQALSAPDLSASRLDRIRAVLTELGARAHVERQVDRLVRTAEEALEQAPIPPSAASRLAALARGFTAPVGGRGQGPVRRVRPEGEPE